MMYLASLLKFQPLVEEIVCTQTFYCIKKFYKEQQENGPLAHTFSYVGTPYGYKCVT